MIAALTNFAVKVTKDYGRVALRELRERCVQIYVEAVNCFRIPDVWHVCIDNVELVEGHQLDQTEPSTGRGTCVNGGQSQNQFHVND